jgi:hypothetical protein
VYFDFRKSDRFAKVQGCVYEDTAAYIEERIWKQDRRRTRHPGFCPTRKITTTAQYYWDEKKRATSGLGRLLKGAG